MVEIEWDGVELPAPVRRSLSQLLGGLARVVDPDGRARLEVEIVGDAAGYAVSITGRDALRRMSAEVRDSDVGRAIHRAVELARRRWEAALDRAT